MTRGRKAAPVLYRADTIDMLGPVLSTYLQTSQEPLDAAVWLLANLNEIRLPIVFKSPSSRLQNQLTRYAVAEFARRKWAADVSMMMGGKGFDAVTSQWVKAEGELLLTLFNLIVDVCGVSSQPYFPAAMWAFCLLEGEVSLRSRLSELDESPPDSKTLITRHFESATGDLKAGENPFTTPLCKQIFDVAIAEAARSTGRKSDHTGFTARSWLPYLDARADAAKFLRKKELKIYEL